MKRILLATLFLSLACATGCGEASDEGISTTASYSGTPGCPDCDDPCEVTDKPQSLEVWGLPLDVTPPVTSVKVTVKSTSESCVRSISTSAVTVVPSEDEWTTSTTACSISSPESAELEIESQSGTTTLVCRLQ